MTATTFVDPYAVELEAAELSKEQLKRVLPAQPELYADSETYSREILGEAFYVHLNLVAEGLRGDIPPFGPAPKQSKSIVDTDEKMWVGTYIYFNRSPLTALLLCLGIPIYVKFHFEGQGFSAVEKDVVVSIKSRENQFSYWVGTKVSPQEIGLTPGLYMVSATSQIGPMTHKCGQFVFGNGNIGERRLQVADQPFTDADD
ncbi:MAG: hypothetical protein AAF609_17985 [Cyanobacteria bacterium P01_C01_bin.120]